jgi:hypothetical protein
LELTAAPTLQQEETVWFDNLVFSPAGTISPVGPASVNRLMTELSRMLARSLFHSAMTAASF